MTITEKEIKINNIPAIILGNPSRNVYLYIHGQGGNKRIILPSLFVDMVIKY